MSRTFTTSRGVVLEFLPIPTFLEKIYIQHPLPQPPTYSVKTVAGAVETHVHDTTTLETDEDRAAWDAYQKNLKDSQEKLNLALMRVVLLRGIKVDLPADEGWIQEQAFIGLSVPDDPRERKIYWLETEVLASKEDYAAVVAGVMEASGVPEEAVRQAEETFRGALGGEKAAGLTAPSNGHAVDDVEPVRAGASGDQERNPAHERVRRARRDG